jgi:hypothetical protein
MYQDRDLNVSNYLVDKTPFCPKCRGDKKNCNNRLTVNRTTVVDAGEYAFVRLPRFTERGLSKKIWQLPTLTINSKHYDAEMIVRFLGRDNEGHFVVVTNEGDGNALLFDDDKTPESSKFLPSALDYLVVYKVKPSSATLQESTPSIVDADAETETDSVVAINPPANPQQSSLPTIPSTTGTQATQDLLDQLAAMSNNVTAPLVPVTPTKTPSKSTSKKNQQRSIYAEALNSSSAKASSSKKGIDVQNAHLRRQVLGNNIRDSKRDDALAISRSKRIGVVTQVFSTSSSEVPVSAGAPTPSPTLRLPITEDGMPPLGSDFWFQEVQSTSSTTSGNTIEQYVHCRMNLRGDFRKIPDEAPRSDPPNCFFAFVATDGGEAVWRRTTMP